MVTKRLSLSSAARTAASLHGLAQEGCDDDEYDVALAEGGGSEQLWAPVIEWCIAGRDQIE
ncbi:hypothetical protein GCM10007920_29670 [Ciceribacter naphthalenivorans]|uniref:Uncharacterized protein n=2 Tax=Alphaproteobacteria TaxID=28211 RepID=A0A512HP65_9HYPH|nr:hypothetical protein RNA01_41690 [Ciceribacter naphthalenivorans]GLR23179.1 hypothetical protein GCM10007920_29670 [Ciceribacter naphthalenivorans]GLT06035.1 hypothetical protein GCM10007926_29670 [Sphingomonas psychrolutea]